MKLHQLQYFAAAAEQGSVRAAAQQLGISATAVSRALMELEESLKVTLIERQAQGITLTMAGRALLAHAKLVRSQIQEATQEMAALQSHATIRLAVGVTPWFAQSLLPLLITRFLRLRPDVRLDILEILGMGYAPLRDGTVDLAIGLSPPSGTAPEIQARPLFSYSAAVVCRAGHARADARSIHELRDQEWLLSRDAREFGPPFSEIFSPADPGIPPARVHLGHSALLTMTQVEMTDMLSIAPWPLIESPWLRGRVQALHLREPMPERVTSLLMRRNSMPTAVTKQFVDCMMDTIAEAQRSDDPTLKRVFHTLEPQSGLRPAGNTA